MEKIKFQRTNFKTGKVEEIEIYDSLDAKRLEEETYEEYKLRRSVIKEFEKKMKKKRNYIHVSTSLIPLKNERGEVLLINNKPMWIDKTKGSTYVKENNN